jgi:hypothetical protein
MGGFYYDQNPAGPQLNRAVFFCGAGEQELALRLFKNTL